MSHWPCIQLLHADDERRDAREREQERDGDLRTICSPAVALALGAQPRLGHVHEPARAPTTSSPATATMMRASPSLPTSMRGSANVNDQSVRAGRSFSSAATSFSAAGSNRSAPQTSRSASGARRFLVEARAGARFGQRVADLPRHRRRDRS